MPLTLSKNNPRRCITAALLFSLLLGATFPLSSAQGGAICLSMPDCSRKRLSLETPEFLAPAPTAEADPGENESATSVTPFIGPDQAISHQSTPERPAITASDEVPLERPEVTAGIKVDLGTVKFNLGYTLPSGQVDEFVRPLGVEFQSGAASKRFSLGVKIPF